MWSMCLPPNRASVPRHEIWKFENSFLFALYLGIYTTRMSEHTHFNLTAVRPPCPLTAHRIARPLLLTACSPAVQITSASTPFRFG